MIYLEECQAKRLAESGPQESIDPLHPAAQDWGPLERLTSDPFPDIHPRLASDGKGHFALATDKKR